MRLYLMIAALVLAILFLNGCSPYRRPLEIDLTKEHWRQQMPALPPLWTEGADHWFFTGEIGFPTEQSDALTLANINVPDFTALRVNGNFTVQIYGTPGHNTVQIYGPHAGVREVVVNVVGHTLAISQARNVPFDMRPVIVRIGVHQLYELTQLGCGLIEGIGIKSDDLVINTLPKARGNIYLSGEMRLREINQGGGGRITVFGVNTPLLNVNTTGFGAVRLCGKVGIRRIAHNGLSDIAIVGAYSPSLSIYAMGAGKITVLGNVNLKNVQAMDETEVYVSQVKSQVVFTNVFNRARVGLSGYADTLHLETFDCTRFEGRNLCTRNAYVTAEGNSHVNVNATNRLFASASGNASIYVYGKPVLLSPFPKGNAVIIPMGSSCRFTGCFPLPPKRMVMMRAGEG